MVAQVSEYEGKTSHNKGFRALTFRPPVSSSGPSSDDVKGIVRTYTDTLPKSQVHRIDKSLEGPCQKAVGEIWRWGRDIPIKFDLGFLTGDEVRSSSVGGLQRIIYPQLSISVLGKGRSILSSGSIVEYGRFLMSMKFENLLSSFPKIIINGEQRGDSKVNLQVGSIEEGVAFIEGGSRGCYFAAVDRSQAQTVSRFLVPPKDVPDTKIVLNATDRVPNNPDGTFNMDTAAGFLTSLTILDKLGIVKTSRKEEGQFVQFHIGKVHRSTHGDEVISPNLTSDHYDSGTFVSRPKKIGIVRMQVASRAKDGKFYPAEVTLSTAKGLELVTREFNDDNIAAAYYRGLAVGIYLGTNSKGVKVRS